MSSMFGLEGQGGAVGHQFINYLAGYTLAQRYGLTFVYSPFVGGHTQIQIDVPVEKWNEVLGFRQKELLLAEVDPDIQKVTLPKINWNQARWNHPKFKAMLEQEHADDILFRCGPNQFLITDWQTYRNNSFKDAYWKARKENPIKSHLVPGKVNVAVHIRRGDITTIKYADRYIKTIAVKRQMELIREVLGDQAFFHIHSEKCAAEKTTNSAITDIRYTSIGFEELEDIPNCKFYLSTDVFETFHNMVECDIFITGQGAFSVIAAYLSSGIKISIPWSVYWSQFPSDCNIIEANKNGSFLPDLLEARYEKNK